MNVYALACVGVLSALLAMTVRDYRGESGVLIALSAGLLLMLYAAVNLIPVVSAVRSYAERASLDDSLLVVLLRALGVCWLTTFAADLCRDAGENAIAGKLTLVGRVLIAVLSLPMFQAVLDQIIGWFPS